MCGRCSIRSRCAFSDRGQLARKTAPCLGAVFRVGEYATGWRRFTVADVKEVAVKPTRAVAMLLLGVLVGVALAFGVAWAAWPSAVDCAPDGGWPRVAQQ